MALGQAVQRLAGNLFLRDLTLQRDAVDTVSYLGLLSSEGPAATLNSPNSICPPPGAHSSSQLTFAAKGCCNLMRVDEAKKRQVICMQLRYPPRNPFRQANHSMDTNFGNVVFAPCANGAGE